MDIKKFLKKVKHTIGVKIDPKEGKKKSLKELIKKLNKRKREINKKLKEDSGKEKKKNLKEDLEIVTMEIKKGKKILHGLYAKNKQ